MGIYSDVVCGVKKVSKQGFQEVEDSVINGKGREAGLLRKLLRVSNEQE